MLDARALALLWLLVEGGVPLVVAGTADRSSRAAAGRGAAVDRPGSERGCCSTPEEAPLRTGQLAAQLRGDAAFGVTLEAADLEGVLERLEAMGLPEDGVRRLGVVLILDQTTTGPRSAVVHYLRPTERDAQGHLQRRPPAVLSAWDERGDTFEDYAWGITPELADRVDRSQADLEERQADRARFLAGMHDCAGDAATLVRAYLAAEPDRVAAPAHAPARPSPFAGGLTEPDPHTH